MVTECLKRKYLHDPFSKLLVEDLSRHKNFEVLNDLIFLKERGSWLVFIPDVTIDGRNLREIIISHAHSIPTHLGAWKVILYMSENCWWPWMIEDMKIPHRT